MKPEIAEECVEREVQVPIFGGHLSGTLGLPAGAASVVVFAHGSGSGRFSPRNQYVAESLRRARLGTLLIDLLTEVEAQDRIKVFDIPLLASRLLAAAAWLSREPATRDLRLCYFGASTGAGAALVAAARRPELVDSVVSRGGRPDLARGELSYVQAPTLLIVGGLDEEVIELNRQAREFLHCPSELVIVPGATHLFSEPGALEEVARLAAEWFLRHPRSDAAPARDRSDEAGESVDHNDQESPR
ncbi:MAG: dienelactone hydrolase family protein [Planctomycetota bacterium]|nr:dienelactone hydrolase family protein [Planctomycetota bacterium]